MKPCRQDNDKVQRNRRWQRPNNVSSRYPQEAVHLPVNWSHRHAHTGQAEDVHWSASGMDNLAIHVHGVCVCDARKNEICVRVNYKLVMMLSDQALDIVRNSPEGVGAEVRRKLPWEYEPGVGIRYGAMLQSLLKRRFGEHDETDLAREIESFERHISKYEQQPSDLISDAIQHMAHQGLKQHIDLSISRFVNIQVTS